MENRNSAPKGDIRIVHDNDATLPDTLPAFLDKKTEKSRRIYSILRELLCDQNISNMLSDFSGVAGISISIIDLDANVLASSKWQKICANFHRVNENSCSLCIESDIELANKLDNGAEFTSYKCKNGLIDCASPITIEGEHVANLFIGQFLVKKPDRDFFLDQSIHFGFDKDAYMSALDEVSVVEEEKIPKIISFLVQFAQLIGFMGMERYKILRDEEKNRQRLEELIKQRTKELDKNIKVLNDAQKVAHIGHWELDIITSKITWSDEVYRIFGEIPQKFEATYEAFLERVHPQDRKKVDDAYMNSIKEKYSYEIVHRITRADSGETRYVQERCEHIYDENAQAIGSLGTVHDITEEMVAKLELDRLNRNLQKRVDEEIAKSKKQELMLMQQQRLTQMGDMITIISHHWRQPLNIIGLLVQNLLDLYQTGELTKEEFENGTKLVMHHLNELSGTLFRLSNLSSHHKNQTLFDVSAITKELCDLYKAEMERFEIAFEYHIVPNIEIFGVPSFYTQILLQLLKNAQEATTANTKESRHITLELIKAEEGSVKLSIQDSGEGISEEVLPRIYDPFFTTKEISSRTGLGLYIAKMIIEQQLHGTIDICNNNGALCVVTFKEGGRNA